MSETKTELLHPDEAGLARAASLLRQGELVAFPTETVYGLGADAGDDRAVALIYAAKGRPSFNPLIVHLPDLEAAAQVVVLDGAALALARRFWPGPLTLVLPVRSPALSPLLRAGLPTVAVRVPGHPLARELLRRTGRPVAAPSANPSGRISPTSAAHVLAGLDGRIAAVLDGGPARVGVESTILGFGPDGAPHLLRPGGITAEALEQALGRPLAPRPEGGAVTSPGQLGSHYAPRASLRLDARQAAPGEVLIGFGPVKGEVSLSESGDLEEAAARLFRLLHRFDRPGLRLAVAPIPAEGLGLAIRDRLARAAAPRPAPQTEGERAGGAPAASSEPG